MPGAEVVAICDAADDARATAMADEVGAKSVAASPEALIDDAIEHEDVMLSRLEGVRRSVELLKASAPAEPSDFTLQTI